MGTFKDSLKKWFYTNNSQAASSNARIPLLTATGDPKGSDTIDNLANVLGAMKPIMLIGGSDYNTCVDQGVYYANSNVGNTLSNSPATGYQILSVYRKGSYLTQTVYVYGDGRTSTSCYFRCAFDAETSSPTFSTWKKFALDYPSFYNNYSDLSSLATALSNISFTGCVGVVTRESDGYPRFRQPDQAASYISAAVGVWVQEGGKLLIVAKDQVQSTKWATSNVSGGTTAKGREAAIADMAGRANTNTIISTLGDNAPAAKYCHEYFPTNVESSDAQFGSGRWWLPSSGELWMIWSHLLEINRIMSIIGGTELNRSQWYWSSTEASAAAAWGLTFYDGTFGVNGKTPETSVRPVSAFY